MLEFQDYELNVVYHFFLFIVEILINWVYGLAFIEWYFNTIYDTTKYKFLDRYIDFFQITLFRYHIQIPQNFMKAFIFLRHDEK